MTVVDDMKRTSCQGWLVGDDGVVTTDDEGLSVGEVSDRAGLSPATLRYYERLGLVSATRTTGNQRRYARHVLRRLAFVAAGQRVGLTLR